MEFLELPQIKSFRRVHFGGDRDQIVVAPLGDIQWMGRENAIAYDALKRHIDEALERGAWFLGMGDYVDVHSPSNRARLRSADLYAGSRQAVVDKSQELVEQLYDRLLKPTTGRWLGMVQGHHYDDLLEGGTTDTHLCSLVKTQFLGDCAVIRLTWRRKGRGIGTVDIWVHHGAGGGLTTAAPLNRLWHLAARQDADIFLMGHTHKRVYAVDVRTYPVFKNGEGRSRHREIRLVGTGGWLKGYVEQSRFEGRPQGNYVEKKMLPPVPLGAPFILITPQWEHPADRGKGHKPPRKGGELFGYRQQNLWKPRIRVEG